MPNRSMPDRFPSDSITLAELGEQQILQWLQRFCPPELIGDDGAAIPWRSPAQILTPDQQDHLVVTTDVLVDGVHFSDRTTPPHSVGWRAAAANLSDLAAMGADPIGLTVGLALPGITPWAWVEGVYRGLTDCGDHYKTPIVGGDLCRSTVATISITALGRAERSQLIQRSALCPGDYLIATGVHGASRAGLELLLNSQDNSPSTVTKLQQDAWIYSHQYPQPRLDWLPTLRHLQKMSDSGLERRAIAGMDSSDGLADAVVQLCRASGCGAEIWGDRLPMPQGLENWVGESKARHWMLYGGEDFELVLGLPKVALRQLENFDAGLNFDVIGQAVDGQEMKILSQVGGGGSASLSLSQGYQHFGGAESS